MQLPAGINSTWLTSRFFPAGKFAEARLHFDREEYVESIQVLQIMVGSSLEVLRDTSVTGREVLTLIGWNYLFKKDYDRLARVFAFIDCTDVSEFPELDVLRLWGLLNSGDPQQVLEKCSEFIATHTSPVHVNTADFLFLQAYAESKLGLVEGAVSHAEIAYSLYRLQNSKLGEGWAGNYLGVIYRKLSFFRESLKWFERANSHYESMGLVRKQSMVHLNLGVTHYKIGDYATAFAHLHHSHEIGVKGDWPHRQCFANIALGNVYRLTRDLESARKHLHTAYNQAQSLQFPREEALALEFLGDVYRDEGAPVEARRFYARAMAIGTRIAPDGDIVMEIHRRVGECHNLEGDQGAAASSLKRALEMARKQGDRYEAAVTLRIMCETAINTGDLQSARKYLDESIAILDEIGARHELAISLFASATLMLQEVEDPRQTLPQIVRLNEAWKQATRALDLFIVVDVRWWTAQARSLVKRVAAVREAQEKTDMASRAAGAIHNPGRYEPGDVIVHKSRVMRDLLQLCDAFARTAEPILITGETGTGKEVIANRLHRRSARAGGQLVVVNVAAIPHTMFDREFFGHVKGAFSGAVSDGEGYAARANGGTLFLDEIGELPMELQPKLLRLLQEGTYQALGDPRERRTDIRLIAATNADLEARVQDGTFRADLYYRLRTLDLILPPVRDRSEDVLPLMRHFLCVAAGRLVDLAEYFNRDSLATLAGYDWPGNVREIAMVARQAHISFQTLGYTDVHVRRSNLPLLYLTGPGTAAVTAVAGTQAVMSKSEIVERSRILVALEETGGSRHLAAKALEIGRSTLYRKMEKYGIPTRRV